MRHPKADDAFNFGVKTFGVIIKVEWVDVLVFLGWILGVGN
ncbi:unannotated protein [freshwater metagenome]|uniref:Unannotated protein n=1 Tax=freshwater metagenome TaxID=449393 RepID=A0A6J7AHK5_9ZZZZ